MLGDGFGFGPNSLQVVKNYVQSADFAASAAKLSKMNTKPATLATQKPDMKIYYIGAAVLFALGVIYIKTKKH